MSDEKIEVWMTEHPEFLEKIKHLLKLQHIIIRNFLNRKSIEETESDLLDEGWIAS